jgi:hypothetical protein
MSNAFAEDARVVTHQINQEAVPHPSANALRTTRSTFKLMRRRRWTDQDRDASWARRKVSVAE